MLKLGEKKVVKTRRCRERQPFRRIPRESVFIKGNLDDVENCASEYESLSTLGSVRLNRAAETPDFERTIVLLIYRQMVRP